jgi:ATP/maltotriose-dependent transcriptional regulator MalT
MQPGLASPVFVGRGTELSTLVAGLESAVAGEPVVVLVGGEAGVGKTRLVEEAAARARAEGARVLTGSCIEVGGEGLPLRHVYGMLLIFNRTDALVHLGRWTEAERLVSEAIDDMGSGAIASLPHMLRASIAVRAGRYDTATEELDAASRGLGWGSEHYTMAVAFIRTELARARGDIEADAPTPAADRVSALADAAARLPAPTPPARVYRALAAAEQARVAGEPARWSEAIDACREDGDPYLIAYALLHRSEADVAAGAREEAAAALEEATRLADDLGAAPLLEEAHALARRARLKLASDTPTDRHLPAEDEPFGLTPREREVLALLAAGRSNPQIAEALFISRKTASVHVSNIIGKLNVSSRGEAAALAHRLGLDAATEPARPA